MENDLWGFAVVGGIFLASAALTLHREHRRRNQLILHVRPVYVALRIVLYQIIFYAMLCVVVHISNLLYQEPFWYSQVFTSKECSFLTRRGRISSVSLGISTMCSGLFLAGLTGFRPDEIIDHAITGSIIHFGVVSAVNMRFPDCGSWWIALVLGTILAMIVAIFWSNTLAILGKFVSIANPTAERNPLKGIRYSWTLHDRMQTNPTTMAPNTPSNPSHILVATPPGSPSLLTGRQITARALRAFRPDTRQTDPMEMELLPTKTLHPTMTVSMSGSTFSRNPANVPNRALLHLDKVDSDDEDVESDADLNVILKACELDESVSESDSADSSQTASILVNQDGSGRRGRKGLPRLDDWMIL